MHEYNRMRKPFKPAGSVFVVVIGFVTVMILLAFAFSSRFSSQARLTVAGDQSTAARFFLESYAADVLWQLRRQADAAGSTIFDAFRNGTANGTREIEYEASSLIVDLARELGVTMGPATLDISAIEPLSYGPAFRQTSPNEEKRGSITIACRISFAGRDYALDVSFPFRVVLLTSPVLRKFVLFFDRLHLEQPAPLGSRDKINIVPVRRNCPQANVTPLTLYGWDLKNRDMNGYVFLGADESKIYLNLVGGAYQKDPSLKQADLEDLWQISPSAFKVTAGMNTFGEEILLNDSSGNPVVVRGTRSPLGYSGHFARFGLLGFSDEMACNELLGDFKIERFLRDDPVFDELRLSSDGLSRSAGLRLFGNRISADFTGFEREVFGKVYSRFFLLSFFEAPSVAAPIPFNTNPDHKLSFAQIGSGRKIEFIPLVGGYSHYMSRIVSGGSPVPALGDEADLPSCRDADLRHRVMGIDEFKPADGLAPATGFARIAQTWFPDGPYQSNSGRPHPPEGSIMDRVSRFFKTSRDFVRASGLDDPLESRCWIDGAVYVNESLDLSEGIVTDNIKGGIVLVRGEIILGDVTRGLPADNFKEVSKAMKYLSQDKMITFVSLTGDKITLTGNNYFGVQLFSFKPELSEPVEQISFANASKLIFYGGLGVSTPQLEGISKQLHADGIYPFFNFVPSLGADDASYSVNIDERIARYDFYVQ